MSKPKIALLLHGGTGSANKYGMNGTIDVQYGYNHAKEHILDVNGEDNVDVFMHSWNVDHKEKLIDLYSPAEYYFEPQIMFNFKYSVGNPNANSGKQVKMLDGTYVGNESMRFHSMFSRWYSAKMSNEIRLMYQKKNNIEYDFVMLSRFDLAWNVDVDFSKIEKNKFIVNPPFARDGLCHDLFFIADSEKMNVFCQMYDYIKTIKHFDHPHIHSHKLAYNLIHHETDLHKSVSFFGEPRPWPSGLLVGPCPLVRAVYKLDVARGATPDEHNTQRDIEESVSERTFRW